MMTTSFIEIDKILKDRINNPIYNTSYPLNPKDWSRFSKKGNLTMEPEKPIAFYFHIPFCRQLCSFCEYTRMRIPDESSQIQYIKTLSNDVSHFIKRYGSPKLYGLDIGGGTPTALCRNAFAELIALFSDIKNSSSLTNDFEPSIEATFETIDKDKISLISQGGIDRISLGIQSSSSSLLHSFKRAMSSFDKMHETINLIHSYGISKVNLDMMYGLPRQTLKDIEQDMETIKGLDPEQVTVYELRTNQITIGLSHSAEERFEQYHKLYQMLRDIGYKASFGQNTFSKNDNDKGLSSYLRHRMYDGWQYKGFGISAQSMSKSGLAYNVGKNSPLLEPISRESGSFEAEGFYCLPKQEILAKFIAISGYSGGFSINSAIDIYGNSFMTDFQPVISYLLSKDYITFSDSRINFTRLGMKYYGPILSLFFPR